VRRQRPVQPWLRQPRVRRPPTRRISNAHRGERGGGGGSCGQFGSGRHWQSNVIAPSAPKPDSHSKDLAGILYAHRLANKVSVGDRIEFQSHTAPYLGTPLPVGMREVNCFHWLAVTCTSVPGVNRLPISRIFLIRGVSTRPRLRVLSVSCS